jgi:hypothetical protein
MNRLSRLCIASMAAAAVVVPAMAQNALQVVAPDQVGAYWVMTKSEVDVDIPNSGRNLDKPGCAAVSYMIGSDGVPRNVVVRKVVPSTSDFGPIAVSAVRNFRYQAAAGNDSDLPISTYYVAGFNTPSDPAAKQALMARCKLPGYSQGQ